MGVFDTIYLDKEYVCPICHRRIKSIQTKKFENTLEDYYLKDCIAHTEETRIIKEELFCDDCLKNSGVDIYIVIDRGILIGTAESLEEAKKLLGDLNLEKLILWYHDLYQRYIDERKEKDSYKGFLDDLHEWYSERLYEKPEDSTTKRIWLIGNMKHLRGALNPVESIERFITYKKMRNVLDELWDEGQEILDIYYPEQMSSGEERWAVDVYQDEVNERCHLNWTWTVISKKQLEMDKEKEDYLPEWTIVVEEPFSDGLICKAIEKWFQDRGYEFGVKMVSLDQAKGSGLIKKLKKIDIEKEKREAIPMEKAAEELDEEKNKRTTGLIEQRMDRKKVFYYQGFHGSLVADVESNKLIGKIEGINENIIYEGKTVRECEQEFKEAVVQYKKDI